MESNYTSMKSEYRLKINHLRNKDKETHSLTFNTKHI